MSSNCTQGTPAGLPPGMPGIGLEIDGAVQQAPQFARQGNEAAGMPAFSGGSRRVRNPGCVYSLTPFGSVVPVARVVIVPGPWRQRVALFKINTLRAGLRSSP